MNTLKVGSTGRFGSRYGVGIRKRVLKVEQFQKQLHDCPFCGFKKVKRISKGIFKCKKCGKKFTGGAFIPETLSGSIIKKMVSQKSFMQSALNLMEAKEKTITRESAEKEKAEKGMEKKEMQMEEFKAGKLEKSKEVKEKKHAGEKQKLLGESRESLEVKERESAEKRGD